MCYIVYILKSGKDPAKHYTGITKDLDRRLNDHNNRECNYSKRFAPWELETYVTFKNRILAEQFERYLKSGSGHAFLNRHFI